MQKTVFSLWYWCKQRCFHLLLTEVCMIKPVVDTYQAMLGTQDREFRHGFTTYLISPQDAIPSLEKLCKPLCKDYLSNYKNNSKAS